jgi:small membrane protein
MSGIQVLLISLVVLIGIYFFIRLRNQVADIVFLSVLAITAIVFILFPDITNRLAKWLQVGRGADLIFYISTLTFWFVLLKLYARQRKLEQTLTKIIRQQALDKETTSSTASTDGE